MEMTTEPDINIAPDFIRFLFSTKPKFDCYFKVGNESLGKPERIGGVKLMLMAHSEVFRLELEESELKEKQDVPIKDIHPDTFRGMLKYVYGHDTTKDMCFDEADNLFYVAEKYLMKTLKDKLALRLMDLLNPKNICSLLNNPACHTHLELNSAITEILRHETNKVLASSQFPLMNADGFLKILEQDGLAVTEIELWRAAIKWAKHRAESQDGQTLCQQLSGLTRHMRLCTLTVDDVCGEVANAEVFTTEEIDALCLSVRTQEKHQDLCISNETEPRKLLTTKATRKVRHELALSKLNIVNAYGRMEYSWNVFTKDSTIELLPLVCRSLVHDETGDIYISSDWTYDVDCTTTITKVNSDSSADEPLVTVDFTGDALCGDVFEIPLTVDGKNIVLLPNSEYIVEMELDGGHKVNYSRDNGSGSYGDDNLTLDILASVGGYYQFPSSKFVYRVVTPVE